MFEHFGQKSLHDRLKDTLFVLKHSFSVVGKDKGIMRPALHAAFFSFFIVTLFFFSLFVIFLNVYKIVKDGNIGLMQMLKKRQPIFVIG